LIRPLFIVWNCLKPFEQFAVCTETVFWTLNRLVTSKMHYMEKNHGMFSSKTLLRGFNTFFLKYIHAGF